jgi:adenosylcobinamide kinase/adenosylcobinamide-phosphate guanylyltransferase
MQAGRQPAYLATAEVLDEEMRERVAAHQQQREGRFDLVEEPLELTDALDSAAGTHDVVMVDCLTLWISNLLGAGRDVANEVEMLAEFLGDVQDMQVILISNEVGLGIVPDNALARTFRDLTGWAHQRLGEICGNVYFVAAGLPMTLKGEAPKPLLEHATF